VEFKRILIVDDDTVVLAVVQGWLAANGHDVLALGEPTDTANRVQSLNPDVLLLDLHMPSMSGEAVARLMKKINHRPDLMIIFFSDASNEHLAAVTREHGAAGFIRKTSNRAEFLANFNRIACVTAAAA
jgi:CheY-like chemotaxis protein